MNAKRVRRRLSGVLTIPLVLLAVLAALVVAPAAPGPDATAAPFRADGPSEDPDFG